MSGGAMATWGDVEAVALALPQVEESTWFRNQAWKVEGKAFMWRRPLRAKEQDELGSAAPEGEILGVRVADERDKAAVLATVDASFTIDHFKNFAAVLIDVDAVTPHQLAELVIDAWLAMAPPALAAAYLAEHPMHP